MTNWNDFRYFLAIHRAGSLGAAGKALKVDQTTVGRRLTALEDELGTRLFDRRTGLLRSPACPPADVIVEYYLSGTEPMRECDDAALEQIVRDSVAAASRGRQPDPAKAAAKAAAKARAATPP